MTPVFFSSPETVHQTRRTNTRQMFSKEQLPKGTRVIRESEEVGLEYMPDRITVVVGDGDTVQQVYRG